VVRVPAVVREGLQCGTRIDLLSVFFHKNYIFTAIIFICRVFANKILNFCVAYFPCWFLKMVIMLSHSLFFMLHLCQFWFSKLFIELYLADWLFVEQGGTWWQYGTHKWYAVRKSSGTTAVGWCKVIFILLNTLKLLMILSLQKT